MIRSSWTGYPVLFLSFLVYSFASVFSKMAASHLFLSWSYLLWLGCAFATLGLFAVLWQQIIKRMPISDAYMFKGSTVVFVMLLSHLFFGEAITMHNVFGAVIIVVGIALFARS